MACNFFKGLTGYKDQRYEVSAMDGDKRIVLGWTNLESGGSLVRMVEKHPALHSPEVKDLKGHINGRTK